jgi:F-type H+-transporting ATPase subunit gamma
MPNTKEIKNRIASISTTMQITSAMKLVSAAKLRKAQEAITKIRPYVLKMTELLQNVSGSSENTIYNPYVVKRKIEKVLLVVISSNKGLCGAFNTNVGKKALLLIEEIYQGKNINIIAVGKKAGDFLRYKGYPVKTFYNDIYNNLTYKSVTDIAQSIMDAFASEEYDVVEVVYNEFKNPATQILSVDRFLPIQIKETSKHKEDYIYEPSQEHIIHHLIPQALKIRFHRYLLESVAGEHGARMTAMHKATDNAQELKRTLTLEYNKMRQSAITNQILEISSGAEALQ